MFWGVGLEKPDTISAVLEEVGPGLSVYNYSIEGYNTVQELIVSKEALPILGPDHFVLGFVIGNVDRQLHRVR